jgi:hypothetical protein
MRLTLIVLTTLMALLPTVAVAHTGEDASTGHILVEFGQWGFGVTGVSAAVLFVFWIRARLRQGSRE